MVAKPQHLIVGILDIKGGKKVMKKIIKNRILLTVLSVCLVLSCAASFIVNASNNIDNNNQIELKDKVVDKNLIQIEDKLKAVGVKVKEYKNPKIDKENILNIAYKFNEVLPKNAKSISAIPAILTDEGVFVNALSEDAKNANSKLKEKDYIYEIPVWIVAYDGLKIERHNQILTEDYLVFDAETGQFLYGFRQ